jgi:DNA-binding transcriptional LysR family regulator
MVNLRSLDLNLLPVFEVIYDIGSVSGAADRLGISQSAASHALSRLREACGDDLFVRGRQGLAPTLAAKAMYPAVSQALRALRQSLAEASCFNPTRSQRQFRVVVPYPMGPFYALNLLAMAAADAPGIGLIFDTVSRPVNLEDNLRDGVDIAIDWLPIALDPFVNKKLFDDRLVLVARGDHPTVNVGVTIEDLRRAEFVGGHRRRRDEDQTPALREFYRLGMKEAVRVSEVLQIATVVAETDLLGMLPLGMAPLMQKLGLRVLEFPLGLPPLPIYMIWHETHRSDAGHCWLRGVLVAGLGGL